jgi:formate dehydrogenase subunit gamma
VSVPTIVRFTPSERAFHWVFAVGYLALLVSGLPLMFTLLRPLIRGYTPVIGLRLHLACGVLWLVATLAAVVLANRRVLGRAWRDLTTFERGDTAWLRRFPRWLTADAATRARLDVGVGRFNAGQKVNAIFTAVTTGLLLLSGLVLVPVGDVPLATHLTGAASVTSWQTAHRWLTLLILLPLAGHIFLAVVFPPTRPSLSGMLGGEVDATWAEAHHPRWSRP